MNRDSLCTCIDLKKAQGKKRKGAPFLAGQYPEYISRQLDLFRTKARYHDRDEEDNTFEDYSDAELTDVLAYIASRDDKPAVAKTDQQRLLRDKERKGDHVVGITQTVLKMPLNYGVDIEDARQALLSKAAEVNLKMVGNQIIHKALRARGIETGILEIYQFCDPEDAVEMVRYNPLYAAYMPCRIALVEDGDGRVWITMLNLDFLIESWALPKALRTIAININGKMLDIVSAAATGEF